MATPRQEGGGKTDGDLVVYGLTAVKVSGEKKVEGFGGGSAQLPLPYRTPRNVSWPPLTPDTGTVDNTDTTTITTAANNTRLLG
jgi:hypothetical protein